MDSFELIQEMSRISGLAPTQCARALDAIRFSLSNALKDEQVVSVREFGSFSTKWLPAMTIVSPLTKATIQKATRKKIIFRASQTLKHAVI